MSFYLELVVDNIIGQLETDENEYCKEIKTGFKFDSVLNDRCLLVNVSCLEEANEIVSYICSIHKITKLLNHEFDEMYVVNLQNNVSVLINYGGYYFDGILNSLKRAGVSAIGLDLSGLLFW